MKFDRKQQIIIKDGQKIELPHKTWCVALALFDAAPEAVSRADLIERIWNDNYYVGEKALNQALWAIRTALGDNARAPHFIRTIPGQGYQWIAVAEKRPTFFKKRFAVAAVLALAVVLIPALDITVETRPTRLAAATTPTVIDTKKGHSALFAPDKIKVTTPEGCVLNILSRPNQKFSTPVFSNNGKTMAFNLSESDTCQLIVVDLQDKQYQKFEGCASDA